MNNARFYDNTRIQAFRRCPRFYYFRHVKHWAPDSKAASLAFGAAWHSAMEVVWPMMARGCDPKEIIHTAFAAWTQEWTTYGFPSVAEMNYELEKELAPRTPGVAFEMLCDYVEKRAPAMKDIELVSVERPFIVPLDPGDDTLFYVGKIDKTIRQRGSIRAIEHKTTTMYKKEGGFRSNFLDGFSPNSQVDGYLYAVHLLFGEKNTGVWIDAALVHRSETAFKFIPIEKPKDQLEAWLWGTRYWIDMIEANVEALGSCSSDLPYMAAFPQNTNSCQDFQRNCEYIDLCRSRSNPLKLPGTPPGFTVEEWDPLKETGAIALLGQEKENGK